MILLKNKADYNFEISIRCKIKKKLYLFFYNIPNLYKAKKKK